MSMWRHYRKCWFMPLFPLKNLARKRLMISAHCQWYLVGSPETSSSCIRYPVILGAYCVMTSNDTTRGVWFIRSPVGAIIIVMVSMTTLRQRESVTQTSNRDLQYCGHGKPVLCFLWFFLFLLVMAATLIVLFHKCFSFFLILFFNQH